MNNWIFTVTKHKLNEGNLTAKEIFNQRMTDSFWGLGEKTPNRKHLKKGDKIIFYIGSPECSFAGIATLKTDSFELNEEQKAQFGHGNSFYTSDYGVSLEDINIWNKEKSVKELLPNLDFIENKQYWGTYFQGGVRQIDIQNFEKIINSEKVISDFTKIENLEEQSEFALESHLEDFIYKNWNTIDWGNNLKIYKTEDQDGRQYPAGLWSIDLLAIDVDSSDLVVIELKRGKTSDTTVGQILRYISWIKENLAEPNQNVRGIIIAKDVDDALKYAVKDLKSVIIKKYQVNFKLIPYKFD